MNKKSVIWLSVLALVLPFWIGFVMSARAQQSGSLIARPDGLRDILCASGVALVSWYPIYWLLESFWRVVLAISWILKAISPVVTAVLVAMVWCSGRTNEPRAQVYATLTIIISGIGAYLSVAWLAETHDAKARAGIEKTPRLTP